MGFLKGWLKGGIHKQQLMALGGAIVPECPYPILKAIAEIEKSPMVWQVDEGEREYVRFAETIEVLNSDEDFHEDEIYT